MPLAIGTQIVTNRIPVQGLIAEQSASALANPVEGLMWHDTANKAYKIYLNGAWMTLGAAGQGIADGDKGDITITSGVWTIDPLVVTAAKIANATITDAQIAAANKDGAIGTVSMRTLGTGAQQAFPGNGRLDQLAAPTASLNFNNQVLTNLQAPTNSGDATNKLYVDNAVQGLDAKASVKCGSTANLSGFIPAPASVDGITISNGDRVLVKNQTNAYDNGIYVMSAGNLVRANDMYGWSQFPGAFTWVEQGTVNADSGWVCTVDQGGTLGTTPVTWTQFGGSSTFTAGTGLTKSGSQFALDTAYTDGRYWTTTGPDSGSGVFTITGGAGNGWRVQDYVQNLECRIYGNGYNFFNNASTQYGYLYCDPANTKIELGAMTGYTLSLNAPKIIASQSPAAANEVATKGYVDGLVTGGTTKKYAVTLGAMTAGAETTITHNLNTTDVITQFRDVSSNYEILFGWRVLGPNTIGVTPDIAYSASSVRAVVIG